MNLSISRTEFNNWENSPLIRGMPNDVSQIIFDILINQKKAYSCISSLVFVCKRWKFFLHHEHRCTAFAHALLQSKESKNELEYYPRDVQNKERNDFTPYEFEIFDRIYKKFPKNFQNFLKYPSGLFQEGSLYCSLLHRYSWQLENIDVSKNPAIRKIAAQHLRILKSLVTTNPDQEKLIIIKNDFSKLYEKSHSNLLYERFKRNTISLLSKLEPISNEGLLLHIAKYYNLQFSNIPKNLITDPELIFFLLKNSEVREVFECVNDELRRDKDFMFAAITINHKAFRFADNTLKENPEFVFDVLAQNFLALAFIDDKFKKDKDFILRVIKQSAGSALHLEDMDEDLLQDQEVLLALFNHCSVKRPSHSCELHLKTRDIALAAVKQDGHFIRFVDDHLKQDREIVLAAVQQSGFVIPFLDEKLKQDREIVLTAVQQNGLAIQFLDKIFKEDREIALAAIKNKGSSLMFFSESLKKDREIVLEAVKQIGYALSYADEIFKKDKEIVYIASIPTDPNNQGFEFADESLKKDREFVMNLVKQRGLLLEFADESLKADKDVVLAAVQQCGAALAFADQSLKADEGVVLAAIKQDGDAFRYAHDIFRKNKEIALLAIRQHSSPLNLMSFIDNSLKNNDLIVEIVDQLISSLEKTSDS